MSWGTALFLLWTIGALVIIKLRSTHSPPPTHPPTHPPTQPTAPAEAARLTYLSGVPLNAKAPGSTYGVYKGHTIVDGPSRVRVSCVSWGHIQEAEAA